MDWVLRSSQIHSTFGNLRYSQADGYHIHENCNDALETILHTLLFEDKQLLTYRRSISFGQNITKDLIPLLVHAEEDKTLELLTQILVNLTLPIECLLSVDISDVPFPETLATLGILPKFGKHTIFEIDNLLGTTKAAFANHLVTKVIIDFLKKNMNVYKANLTSAQCTNIANSLLLLRNILHIPEENNGQSPNYNGPSHSIQNQILWNIFSQGIDKVLIKLITIPDAKNWSVTMVQLIALLYKDQPVVTLNKLLNQWLSEGSSTDDNESNTSPLNRSSGNSSPILSSDLSDTGESGKNNDEPNVGTIGDGWNRSSVIKANEKGHETSKSPNLNNTVGLNKKSGDKIDKNGAKPQGNEDIIVCDAANQHTRSKKSAHNSLSNNVVSKKSDRRYGDQELSTSSNDDDFFNKIPIHQKPHNKKQKKNNKGRSDTNLQERKIKKIIKRAQFNMINAQRQGLLHKTPTDDDISNILKQFTVDFIFKGYNSLVQTLHTQILTNLDLEIDTSHFFWLLTYFMKFATQIELDMKHVCTVLSFDIVSYLTAEGVNLCEQFQLAIKLDGNDLKANIRKLHLVVTAVREIVQSIEVYRKFAHISKEDQNALNQLQIKMCETEEFRSLLLLLLRHYNPQYHTKQYLQDLVVTNHILSTFLDNGLKMPEYKGATNMHDHLKQFATTQVMYQYSLLLEDYADNGEFVNDCIFTIMHHVAGDLESMATLFQPKILKTFTSIWKSEFEICDDWSDLIYYVINMFGKKPHVSQKNTTKFRLIAESFNDDEVFSKPPAMQTRNDNTEAVSKKESDGGTSNSLKDRWTDDKLSSLYWNYMQCSASPDAVGKLVKMFKEDGMIKTRDSIIKELFKQNLIVLDEFEKLTTKEMARSKTNKEMIGDDTAYLCEQLTQDGNFKFLDWVQKVLLETCFAKIHIEKHAKMIPHDKTTKMEYIMKTITKKFDDLPTVSPVSYHSLLLNQSVPLVPWNCEQASICKDLKFLRLLQTLGFHMPVDCGKVFIRIPNFWTAEVLFDVAGKISHINQSTLKFSINDILERSNEQHKQESDCVLAKDLMKDVTMIETSDNDHHLQKRNATMVNSTPIPSTSHNSEPNYSNKPNWFELVQMSKKCKIVDETVTLNVLKDRSTSNEAEEGQSGVKVPVLLLPSLPTVMSVQPEPSYSEHPTESDYNYQLNSMRETASIASDLTMCMSDENEKPEDILFRPLININLINDDLSSDMDVMSPKKRPRLESP